MSAMAWLLLKGLTCGNRIQQIDRYRYSRRKGVRLTLDGRFCGVFTSENTFGKILSEKVLSDEQAEESHPEFSTHEPLLPEGLYACTAYVHCHE